MLKHVILALLSRGELSGYELKKRFDSSVVFFWHATAAQIYAELKRMEADGLIAGQSMVQEKYPTKRVYRLTDEGLAQLIDWLREPNGLQKVKDDMQLRTFVFDLLAHEEAIRQLERHRELQVERLSEYEGIRERLDARYGDVEHASPESAFFSQLSLEYGIRSAQTYLEWCDWAIQRIRVRSQRSSQVLEPLNALPATADSGATRTSEQRRTQQRAPAGRS